MSANRDALFVFKKDCGWPLLDSYCLGLLWFTFFISACNSTFLLICNCCALMLLFFSLVRLQLLLTGLVLFGHFL